MRRWIPAWMTLGLILLTAMSAAAQTTRIDGQVMNLQGAPYAGVTVIIKNTGSAQTYTLKADNDGKFSQLLPGAGTYAVTIMDPMTNLNYTEQHTIGSGQPNQIVINLKEIAAQSGANPEEQKKQEAANNSFKEMKQHFDAGNAAMTDVATQRASLATAPDKSAVNDKIKSDAQTAITEFKAAEQGVGAKDVKNHALVWANLGQAYDAAGQFDDAAGAYQKAIDLQPMPVFYTKLSLALANSAATGTDPAAQQQKVTDAGAACDKAAAADPTNQVGAAGCWKNIGIILNNKGDLKDAVAPFQKATQLNAKDAQAWFLLGGALTGEIETKTEGDKVTYTIPPGTLEAYQKCIDADPMGPYAAQAKAALDGLAAYSTAQSTGFSEKKPTKKKSNN